MNEMDNTPVIKKGSGISPIWVLPLVALMITGWLLYTSYRDAGIPITIHFEDAEGITPGKTQVMYKGLAVGLVERITVDEDLQGVSLKVKMDKKARRAIVEDTKFWIVKPQISAGRISGLETILSGSYIAVQPGSSEEFASHFEGLPDAPPPPPDSPGLHLTLMSEALYSLQKGSPVYTKNLKIGRVLRYYFAEDKSVLIDVYIEPEYSHFIQMGTRFWNSSGIAFEGNIQSGLSVKFQSLASLIHGGISCATPEALAETSPPALSGLVYKLYKDYEAAEYGIPMALQLASGEGIVEGKTKVMYRGLEAGVVQNIVVKVDEGEKITVTAEILLDPRAEPILKKNTRFWVVRPEVSIEGINSIDALVSGAYITFIPGDGIYRDHFVVEKKPMPRQIIRDGAHFILVSPTNEQLEPGSPVLYKGLEVGEVAGITLAEDEQSVRTDIIVYAEYTSLVRQNSVFWTSSSVEFDAGFSGIRLDVGTVKSIFKGGIAFTTPQPEKGEARNNAEEETVFQLFASRAEAAKKIAGLSPPGTLVHLQSRGDVFYRAGTPVLYRKVPVGEVLGSSLSADLQTLTFDVLVYEKFAGLMNSSSLFYDISGFTVDAGLGGIDIQAADLSSLVTGGIAFITPRQGGKVKDDTIFPLYMSYEAALEKDNVPITLHLSMAEGVKKGTELRYHGIAVGTVKEVYFGPQMEEIRARATVRPEAAELFTDTTRLLLVGPSIGLAGVKNLSTLLAGPYIQVIPGEGQPGRDFIVHAESAAMDDSTGLQIILEAPGLGFLDVGNPVYYRQVEVGRVIDYVLSPTAQKVLVKVNIRPPFAKLVYRNTKFWVVSGFRASGGLFSGLQMDVESLATLIAGGIAFATPEGEKKGAPAENGDHFPLYEEKKPEWTTWTPELKVIRRESQVDKPPDSQ